MVANLLIGLREGLEMTIVASILVAFLVKTRRRDRLPALWWGVGAALVLPVSVAVALAVASKSLTFEAQELLGGTLWIVAVAFVTWMVFWMRRAGRHLASDLRDRLGAAADVGALAVALTAFLAVGREGLETVFFVYAAAQATGETWQPLLGAAVGLAIAVALGWCLYRQALRVDLRRFFTWSGAALVVVAGGVLAYGVHDLQEAGALPGLTSLAFDVTEQVPPSSWYAVLLRGVFNSTPATTWLQAIAWTSYTLPVLALYLRPDGSRREPSPAPAEQPVTQPASRSTAA